MKQLLLPITLLFCLSLTAQNQAKLDSLNKELKKWGKKTGIQADTNLYNLYYNIGVEFQNTNPDTAIYFLNKSIAKAKQLKDKIREAESLRAQGWSYFIKGDYPQAIELYQTALKKLPENMSKNDKIRKEKVVEVILGGIGMVYSAQGDNTKALEYYFKSLKISKDIANKKGQAVNLGNIGLAFSNQGNNTKALEYYFMALKINEEVGNKNGQAANLGNIGRSFSDQGDNAKALEYYFKALKINKEIGNKNVQTAYLGNIGSVYLEQGNYAKTLEYYFKSLKINEEIGNKRGYANNLGNIGIVYMEQGDFAKALEYYFKSLKINEEIGNKQGQLYNLGNIGMVYSYQDNKSKSLEYYFKSLKINEEISDKHGQAANLGNIGIIYENEGDFAINTGDFAASADNYNNALVYYFKALKINEEIENKRGQAINSGNIGRLYIVQKKHKEAEKYLKSAIQIGDEIHSIYYLKEFYQILSDLYTQTDRHKEALEAYKTHILYRDSVLSEENQKALVQKEMQFEYEKKAATDSIANAKANEIKNAQIAKQKAEIKAKRNQQYALYGGLALVLLFAGFVYNRLKVTQKQKIIIEQKERETHAQKEIIEEKHKEITDSINYAERIQRSFLATKDMLDKYLGVTSSSTEENTSHPVTSSSPKNEGVSRSERGYFVFFRPKDVVSGDFYWAAELNNGNFAFTCADSTGHGVPGAIMSILNISSLEKSVEKDTEPHQILNTTRRIIIDRLKKDGSKEGGKDGMDCSLFVLNKDKSQLSFAAANNPVFILRAVASSSPEENTSHPVTSSSPEENTSHPVTSSSPKNEGVSRSNNQYEILEYKPDKMPVGKHDKENEPFTLHTLQLQKGDVIYTLTDGFADQFGGDKGKKYMIKNVKELLLNIAHLPMPEQEQKLAEEFAAWKGKNEQVDDVCVIGVRI